MINLLLSLAAGLVGFVIAHAAGLPVWSSILPGIVLLAGVFFLLARRTGKQLDAVMQAVQREMAARKPDAATKLLSDAFPLARWQFGVAKSLHANLGILLYVQKKFDEAVPHLEKGTSTLLGLNLPQAMLGAHRFRKKDYAGMESAFETAIKGTKKDSLIFAVYAWCEMQRGEKKKAIEILQKGVAENASDEKLKTLLQRAQNDKRLKMDAFGEQWWQFWLENPPMMQGPGGGAVFSGRQRFGRGFRR